MKPAAEFPSKREVEAMGDRMNGMMERQRIAYHPLSMILTLAETIPYHGGEKVDGWEVMGTVKVTKILTWCGGRGRMQISDAAHSLPLSLFRPPAHPKRATGTP